MSTARFLAAAVAIYGIAISAGVVLYLIFRDSLEDLRAKLQQRLVDRHESVQSTRARSVQFGAPQVWESAAVDGGPVFLRGLRQRLTPVPSRLAWAVLAVVALAAAAVVGATHDFGSSSATGPRASVRLQAGPWNTGRLWRSPHGHASPAKRAAKQSARHAPPTRRTQAQHTQVVSNLQPVSEHTAPVVRQTFTAAGPQGGGPTPLRSPKSGSTPTPLRSP